MTPRDAPVPKEREVRQLKVSLTLFQRSPNVSQRERSLLSWEAEGGCGEVQWGGVGWAGRYCWNGSSSFTAAADRVGITEGKRKAGSFGKVCVKNGTGRFRQIRI